MPRLRLTGVVGTGLVAVLVLGSLAVLARTLVGETASMAVLLLVVVVFFVLGTYGERAAGGGTSYW